MTGKSTWLVGLASAARGMAVAEVAAAILDGRSPIDSVGRLLADKAPLAVVEETVRLLRAADKPVARVQIGAGALLAGAGAGMLAHRRPVIARMALAVASVGVGLAGVRATHRSPGPTLAAVALGSATVVPGLRPRVCSKGRLLGEVVLGVSATALAPRLRRRRLAAFDRSRDALELPVAQPLGPPRDGAEGWEEAVAPLMTPLNTFYVTDTNFEHPLVDLPRWTLDVGGLAEAPARFTWADLVALGLEEFDATLVCVHNRLGWDRLGTTRWTGIPLQRVIAAVTPSTQARYVRTEAVDGFAITHPLEQVMGANPPSWVVLGMAGRPLGHRHGFPARIITPGVYGQFGNIKWLRRLTLQSSLTPDHWTGRGWPQVPMPVRPLSRIDHPAEGQTARSAAGVAWAPPLGVRAVEVRLDGGAWHNAELAAELAPDAWRRWRADLTDIMPSRRSGRTRATLEARVIGRGAIQDPVRRVPFPSGASGLHRVNFTLG